METKCDWCGGLGFSVRCGWCGIQPTYRRMELVEHPEVARLAAKLITANFFMGPGPP
jgi:hypothetical protein